MVRPRYASIDTPLTNPFKMQITGGTSNHLLESTVSVHQVLQAQEMSSEPDLPNFAQSIISQSLHSKSR